MTGVCEWRRHREECTVYGAGLEQAKQKPEADKRSLESAGTVN